jgi:hypothetical protein
VKNKNAKTQRRAEGERKESGRRTEGERRESGGRVEKGNARAQRRKGEEGKEEGKGEWRESGKRKRKDAKTQRGEGTAKVTGASRSRMDRLSRRRRSARPTCYLLALTCYFLHQRAAGLTLAERTRKIGAIFNSTGITTCE